MLFPFVDKNMTTRINGKNLVMSFSKQLGKLTNIEQIRVKFLPPEAFNFGLENWKCCRRAI